MRIGSDRVEYNVQGQFFINGMQTAVSGVKPLPGGGAIYPATRGGWVFAWPDGQRVIATAFSGTYMSVSSILTSELFGHMEGFLGNADGDPNNDFQLTRGSDDLRSSLSFLEQYKSQPNFENTWRVGDGDELLVHSGADCTDLSFPPSPTWLQDLPPAQLALGEMACAGIADEIAREPCILDVGTTSDPGFADAAAGSVAELANQGQTAPATSVPRTVYFQDFSGTLGPEWDTIVTSVTPLGDRGFLGEFGNETVRLTIDNLAVHDALLVSFDLFVINGWDGDGPFGPNTWRAAADGTEVANYTFSNTFSTQSFPDFGSAAGTGAFEANTLFYPFGDSIYRITLTIPHSASSLALDLSAEGLSGIFNEAWGVSNFEIRSARTPAPLLAPRVTATVSSTAGRTSVLRPLH
jgi:hypothetical protein